MPTVASSEPAPQQRQHEISARRHGWLDALRGIAALAVVFDHLSPHVLRGPRHVITPWFDSGKYGVMVFFLVSGYIVPASLERRGSVRGFWVSRVFRLYPMWAVVIAAVVALEMAGIGMSGMHGVRTHPTTFALAHALMLQDLLVHRNAVNVLWTLSYEMAFYLLITFLFVARAHRRSAGFAVGFAAVALAFGGILPTEALAGSHGMTRMLTIAVAVAVVAGLAMAAWGGRLRLSGAAVIGVTVLLLLAINGRAGPWESFSILAWMFTGTVLYRAERGQVSREAAAITAAVVLLLTIASGVWHVREWGMSPAAQLAFQRTWVITYVLAAATFAVGMACWRERAPQFLAWVGVVSYSAYLLHPLLLAVFFHLPWTRQRHITGTGALIAVVFLACLLGCCWLSYRYVEAPMQRFGRKVAPWIDRRFGSDAAVDQAAATEPVPEPRFG